MSRMKEIGIKGGELIAINTDAQDLLYTNSDHKIRLNALRNSSSAFIKRLDVRSFIFNLDYNMCVDCGTKDTESG